MTKTILLWALGGSLSLGVGLWRYFTPPPVTAHVVLLADRSRSMPDGCNALAALGQSALTLPNIRPRSTLALFATTDRDPLFVASFRLPVGRLSTEGKRRQQEREKAFLDGLSQHCAELPRTQTSPLFRSIKQAVAYLRALGGDKPTTLYLLARTDLRETVDPAIRKALRGDAVRTIAKRTALPPIDNTGVNITLCGYAETSPDLRSRDSLPGLCNTEQIKAVWTALFSHPELVWFEPYCSKLPTQLEAR